MKAAALPAAGSPLVAARWALLFGNFVIGCGMMVAPGTLNDVARDLAVSVAAAGQLITVGAASVCFGAPLLAGWVAGFDRRRLLAASLLFFSLGHLACALMPSYATLLPMRALAMLGAAVFTPQAAAAIGFMSPPEERGRSITFIFLGWSIASVLGLPLCAWVGDAYGWRVAFAGIAAIAAIGAAWVHGVVPDGVRPAGLSLASWKRAFTSPLLMAIVAVTFLSGAGQFSVFSYFTPYYRDVLHATSRETALLLIWFGVFGIAGSVVLTRVIDRVGPHRAATALVGLIAISFLAWPFAAGLAAMAIALIPWGLGCFAGNSAQQARLSAVAPTLAPALLALNTSAIYLGQATGAASGGWLIAHTGFGAIGWAGFAWLAFAVALSLFATRLARGPAA